METDVVVVGAGPTGLMAANWLARLGVDAVVVDRKAGPTRESRALGLQARSMEIYDQLGLGETVRDRAPVAMEIQFGAGRRTVGTVPMGEFGVALTPYPGIHILEQSANEEILAANFERLGGRLLWSHGFVSLQQGTAPPRVSVAVEGPDGALHGISARYVVAADGASSPVRSSLDIGFRGVTNDYTFYVLDVAGTTGLGSGINARVSSENFLLAFPMAPGAGGGRRDRLLGVVGTPDAQTSLPGTGTGDVQAPGRAAVLDEPLARRVLADEFGVGYGEAAWFSTYRVHHRVADTFRSGPVFLAGDAAHIHSPVGGQGMNTGLQDAHNLACKLADVLQGRMPESYLDRYEAERRPVAQRLVKTTDRMFGLVVSKRPAAVFVRTRVLPKLWAAGIPLLPISRAGGRVFGYLSQTRIHYWMTEGERRRAEALHGWRRWGRRGKVLGRRLPWTGASPAHGGSGTDNFAVLREAVWQVHGYGPSAEEAVRRLAARHGFPVHLFPAAPGRHLPDGAVAVVRPDGFVAAMESPLTAAGATR